MRTSPLARLSLLFGVLTPLTVCVQLLWMTSAVGSIVCGHLALRQIKREPKRVGGKGIAIVGLLLGYTFGGLLLLLTAFITFATGPAVNAPGSTPRKISQPNNDLQKQRLEKAESLIASNSKGNAHGNSREAIELAAKFSDKIKAMRDEFFTKNESLLSMSGGEFVTYCELQSNRCAFVVHVPNYRKFSSEAKTSLAHLAWLVGQETTRDTLQHGDSIGIGLKGIALYGSVMVGKVGELEHPNLEDNKSDELLPFFANVALKPAPRSSAPSETPLPPDEPKPIEPENSVPREE